MQDEPSYDSEGEEKSGVGGEDSEDYWAEKEITNRFQTLKEVLRTVKCHADMDLNNEFDPVI